MKTKLIPTTRVAILCTAFCAALLGFSQNANALALTIGDSHELGWVANGWPSGDPDRLIYVNHLIGMAVGAKGKADGQSYARSTNAFGPLQQAVWAGYLSGTGATINLGAGGLYTYLFAKYDGPNYGAEVWYVGNLSGIITIPASAGGVDLSGWTLFRGEGGQVPDGGTTVMLLGAALGALGIARRYIMS